MNIKTETPKQPDVIAMLGQLEAYCGERAEHGDDFGLFGRFFFYVHGGLQLE